MRRVMSSEEVKEREELNRLNTTERLRRKVQEYSRIISDKRQEELYKESEKMGDKGYPPEADHERDYQ